MRCGVALVYTVCCVCVWCPGMCVWSAVHIWCVYVAYKACACIWVCRGMYVRTMCVVGLVYGMWCVYGVCVSVANVWDMQYMVCVWDVLCVR